MELYTFYQSSTSYRVRIALSLKNLAPEMHFVSLTAGEQRADSYEAINPQRNLPLLIDGGQALTQSLAIMEYLDEAYPNPPLLPGDVFMRAHIRALSLVVAADTSPPGNLKVRKYLTEQMHHSEEEAIGFVTHWIAQGFAALEKILESSPYTGTYCVGDSPTMADCCLVPQIFTAKRWKMDLMPYPTIRRIGEVCDAQPAFIAAHPSNQPDAKK